MNKTEIHTEIKVTCLSCHKLQRKTKLNFLFCFDITKEIMEYLLKQLISLDIHMLIISTELNYLRNLSSKWSLLTKTMGVKIRK